jgi:hypothetical protein
MIFCHCETFVKGCGNLKVKKRLPHFIPKNKTRSDECDCSSGFKIAIQYC